MRGSRNEHTSSVAVAYFRAAIIAVAPFVLLAAFAYHPHIMFLPSAEAVAHAVQADTLRWGIAHLGVGVGAALMTVAFVAVGGHLGDVDNHRPSVAVGVPLAAFGAGLYAILPGMEFTVLAAAQTGADVVAAQKAIDSWFVPTMMSSAIFNAAGLTILARAISGSDVLAGRMRSVVVAALFVMAVSRFVPIGPVQFYVQGVAGIVAFWPIAYHILKRTLARDLEHAQPMPAV
jgi:hypothetical protein